MGFNSPFKGLKLQLLNNVYSAENAYVSNHMKTKTDQHPTHNTLISVPTFPR